MAGAAGAQRVVVKKGLDIPISGAPEQSVEDAPAVTRVAAVGVDHVGLRPQMHVDVGDRVRLGEVLFTDKNNDDIPFTAPGAGDVIAINRGAKRVLQSVVIRLDGDEAVEIDIGSAFSGLGPAEIRRILIESGTWTAFRRRPFDRVPNPAESPDAIFVTAIDTRPLAADPEVIVGMQARAFRKGLETLLRLGN